MKRLVLLLLALCAVPAFAAHGDEPVDPNAVVDKKKETAEFILHHVADDTEFEYELPFAPWHLPAIRVAEAFSFLQFGTCDAHAQPGPGFENFPALEQFLHGCYDLRPTKAILMLWFAAGLLFLLLFLGRKRDQNGVPKGMLSHLIEILALFVRDDIAVPNLGKAETARYLPYLTSLFFFVLTINWLSLVPGFFAGTSVITVTAALAIITFLFTQLAAIRAAGFGGYLSHLTGGLHPALWIIMVPVEFIGLFTKPFALALRLFANMFAGHMAIFFLLGLIFMWHPGASLLSVPIAVALFMLEIFVGIVQAYLFALLTALFIGQGVAMGHHDHAHGDDHAH